MFDAISRLFAAPKPESTEPDTNLAVATLLVHLTNVDGVVTAEEQQTLTRVLKDHFELDKHQVAELIEEATRRDKDAVDFYQFTATLSKLEEEERVAIIRLMWQVVFADAENHELEDNMVWRVAELIGISNRQRTVLRQEIKQEIKREANRPTNDE